MAYKDLRDFLKELEKRKLLSRIKVQVDPYLEIAHVTDRVVKKGGPALLFENVSNSVMPVLTNTLGTMERLNMALGVDDLSEISERITELLSLTEMQGGFLEKIKSLPKLKKLADLSPKIVKKAPCQEIVNNQPSLEELPVLTTWPQDAGPFITLPLVFTRNLQTGSRNMGMYRMQIFDSQTTGMHWHLHKDGAANLRKAKDKIPVAVALGGDPVLTFAATAPLPYGMDELLLAAFIRQEPVELVKCKSIDLEVPASSEIVLEGYVDLQEKRREGPFGDHTGFYSLADKYPVFKVICLTRRSDAIYPATVVGKPPMEDTYLAKATERIFLPIIKFAQPEIVDINLPAEGGFHNLLVVSIRKSYPGQAFKVMHALWGLGQMMFTKMIVVVDAEVDVQDLSKVLFYVSNNVDPQRDILLVKGPLDVLDHSSPTPLFGSKIGIDATRKVPGEGHNREWPDELEMKENIMELVQRKWHEYGIEI